MGEGLKTLALFFTSNRGTETMAPKKKADEKSETPTKSTAQKPLETGDVSQFPKHAFRMDLGESLPPQEPFPANTK